jgi:GH35 family endo-1,4-beta-xylanase
VDGWTSVAGCTLANSTADAHSGSHSLLVTGRTADYDGPQISVSDKMYNGSVYSVSVWVKLAPSATQNDTLRLTLAVTLGGATTYQGVVNNTPVPLGTWVNLSAPVFSMAYAYDPGQASLKVESNSGTQSFYVDDFQLNFTRWTPLRDVARQHPLQVGTAADYADLNQIGYTTVLSREYSVLQPENDMKWATIHPNPPGSADEYNFVPGDGLVTFAQAHGMKVRGHNLVWYIDNPAWLTNGNYTAAELNQILHDHITTVVGHYKGQVFAWDVINEAIDDTTNELRNSIWYNQPGIGLSGNGYIMQAFQWAHEADPDALLFWNEYGVEDINFAKSTALYNMVQELQSQGVPIGGVGLQMHITTDPDTTTPAGLDANIARLTALGLQVHITEMDVRLPVDENGVASSADILAQAQRYHDIAAVCVKYPLCTLFQTWGFTDQYSWIPSFYPGYGAALPFDANYDPKPAYYSLRDLFTGGLPDEGCPPWRCR